MKKKSFPLCGTPKILGNEHTRKARKIGKRKQKKRNRKSKDWRVREFACFYTLSRLVARAIRNAIRANRFARIIRNRNPYFYSASGRFARITRTSDSRESPDSRESCESIRANHATKLSRDRLRDKLLCSLAPGPIFIHAHPPTPENTLLGVGGV